MGALLGRAPLYIPSTGVPGQLPEPQRFTYYAGIGALGVLGVLEWPVALVLAGARLGLGSTQPCRTPVRGSARRRLSRCPLFGPVPSDGCW